MKSSKELVEAFEANCRDLCRGRDSSPRFRLDTDSRAVFFEVNGGKGRVALDHLAEHAREMRWVAGQMMAPMLNLPLERVVPDLYDESLDRKAKRLDTLREHEQAHGPPKPKEIPEQYRELADEIKIGAPEARTLPETKTDDNSPIEIKTDAGSAASDSEARPDHSKKKRGRPRKPKS